MRKLLFCFIFAASCLIAASLSLAAGDMRDHPSCPLCGMDRQTYAHSRMLFQYDDGSSLGTCSIHCAAMELALNRHKTVRALYAADRTGKKLVDAKKAVWVIGGSKPGVMTGRAKWAFEKSGDADAFTRQYGGQIASFDDAMNATFQDMYGDIKLIQQKRARHPAVLQDAKDHPECKHCGMKRTQFAFSRMLIKYDKGPATGTCSIHCASIDLALSTDRMPEVILVGDYTTKRLIDAERAVWVIGGKKTGVMSIKGKWAFANKEDALSFIRENGGQISSFDEAMKVTFEDMYEILRP